MLNIGDAAPAFSAADQYGETRTLSECKESWLLLYFYPKDDTPGCTTEACELRDNMNALRSHNIKVVGISADSVESHTKFSSKFALQFPLLADTSKEIIKAYGVWGEKSMYNKTYMGILRTSFLIDPNGIVQKVYEKVKPEGHADMVIKDIQEMKK